MCSSVIPFPELTPLHPPLWGLSLLRSKGNSSKWTSDSHLQQWHLLLQRKLEKHNATLKPLRAPPFYSLAFIANCALVCTFYLSFFLIFVIFHLNTRQKSVNLIIILCYITSNCLRKTRFNIVIYKKENVHLILIILNLTETAYT